jgi:DNA-binding response OmpR family regulator
MTHTEAGPPVTVRGGRAGPAPTILVADHDEAVRASVSDILRLEGYAVSEAGDADTARRLLEEGRFDAFVLDDRMPQLDATAVLDAAPDPPPAVIMSAADVDATGRKDLAVHGIAYLHKPVDPEHLLDAVATALGRGRRRNPDLP